MNPKGPREEEEEEEKGRERENEMKERKRERLKATYHLENDICAEKPSLGTPGLNALVLHVSMRTM